MNSEKHMESDITFLDDTASLIDHETYGSYKMLFLLSEITRNAIERSFYLKSVQITYRSYS